MGCVPGKINQVSVLAESELTGLLSGMHQKPNSALEKRADPVIEASESGNCPAASDRTKNRNPKKEPHKKWRATRAKDSILVKKFLRCLNVPDMKLDTQVKKILLGKIAVECPATAKTVRIFTSSTFTDTKLERNYLMERTYPRLKQFCQGRGYEFQVVDMRWGIRDEATDDHMTTELCLKEIKLCQKLSTGPNFVTFLSHKYGYRPCPRVINAKLFERFLTAMADESKQLLTCWYKRDDNAVPPLYILQSVSAVFPDFQCREDDDKRKEARKKWWQQSNLMHQVICSAALDLLDKEEARQFLMSVTETEITAGILNTKNAKNHCLWFKRNIVNIENEEKNEELAKFIECLGEPDKDNEAQRLLRDLKDDRIMSILPESSILSYDIQWSTKGVDPKENQHKVYMMKLCRDFEDCIVKMINEAIEQRGKTSLDKPLYEEIMQHTLFCQKKCESFSGRLDTMKKIQEYVESFSRQPLVLYGESGCGKTSIMAMAAKLAEQWLDGSAAVILRFLGTTPSSSNMRSLLSTIIDQVQMIYSDNQEIPTDQKKLTERFLDVLKRGTETKPLLLILDSLDQLNSAEGGRQLSWFPKNALPLHTKVIVSTLPGREYESFPRLQSMVKDLNQFLEVPKLAESDLSTIVNRWLATSHRTLTKQQMDILLQSFQNCPLPLFLKLSFDEACSWKSYSLMDATVLKETVRESIISLFTQIEIMHGKLLVSRSLGYLTLAKNGLSESELEDILSCDEDVLNDVYMYWTPPIRRLPPLLLVRVKHDLQEYLVDRGADSVRVFYWYHRQFIEAAKTRYCSDLEETRLMEHTLADYFSGTWACGNSKPFVDKMGRKSQADRLVAAQPLEFENGPNLRKLNNLPIHLIRARLLDRLKGEVLCNFEFLMAKLKATSVRQILDDFTFALNIFKEDSIIRTVTECLQLSQDALNYDPNLLPVQLLGRLPDLQELNTLLSHCQSSPVCFLEPDRRILIPPGGQLVHCIPAHKADVTSLDITCDGTLIATCGHDGTIKFWDILKGHLVNAADEIWGDPEKVRFCDSDRLVASNPEGSIVFVTVETAEISHRISIKSLESLHKTDQVQFDACGKDKTCLVILAKYCVYMYDVSGVYLNKINITQLKKKEEEFFPFSPIAGSANFSVAATGSSSSCFVMKLLTSGQYLHEVTRQPLTDNEDEDELTADALAISHDEKHMFVNYSDDLLFVYNLKTMEKTKTLKGEKSDKLHLSLDDQFLYFSSDQKIMAWDLKADKCTERISQSGASVVDVVMKGQQTVVMVSQDANLRIWDLSRKDNQFQIADDINEKSGTVRSIQQFNNPRYIFFNKVNVTNWFIYDIFLKKVIFGVVLDNASVVKLLNDEEIIVETSTRKLKVVNLKKLKVVKVFQGRTAMYGSFVVIKQGEEVVATSRGRMNLKVYEVSTGMVSHMLKAKQDERIDEIKANQSGTVLAATTDEGPCLLFDLMQYQLIQKISSPKLGTKNMHIADCPYPITSDGNFLLICVDRVPEGLTSEKTDTYIIVWNINDRKIQSHLVDIEYMKQYEQNNIDVAYMVDNGVLLNDRLLVSSHYDCILRVFDLQTGKIKHRLERHIGKTDVLTAQTQDCPFFLSWGKAREEAALCLWDKSTFTCWATFKCDQEVKCTLLSSTGAVIGGGSDKVTDITTWWLKGGNHTAVSTNDLPPILFQETELGHHLNVSDEKIDEREEENDPDLDESLD